VWVNESLDELQQHGWNWSSRMRLNMMGKPTHKGWNWCDKQKPITWMKLHSWNLPHKSNYRWMNMNFINENQTINDVDKMDDKKKPYGWKLKW
jgi:hypothetical protein